MRHRVAYRRTTRDVMDGPEQHGKPEKEPELTHAAEMIEDPRRQSARGVSFRVQRRSGPSRGLGSFPQGRARVTALS
jgi:hypothetical protein